MNLNPEDINNISYTVKTAVESLSKNKGCEKKILASLANFCYSLGYERGYSDGHTDEKKGVDQRIAHVQLN